MNRATPESRIKYLTYKILEHDDRYYNQDNPVISDGEYDRLYNLLLKLEAAYPEHRLMGSPTERVPGAPSHGFKKIKHLTPMYSLAKVHTEEEFLEWDRKLKERLM